MQVRHASLNPSENSKTNIESLLVSAHGALLTVIMPHRSVVQGTVSISVVIMAGVITENLRM